MRIATRAPAEEPESPTAPGREAEDAVSEDSGGEPAGGPQAGVALAIEGLGHRYGELRVLERLDLVAEPGSVVGLVGPSGCGKSTLLELIAGLRQPEEGRIEVGGVEAADRLRHCAYMPQRDLLLPWLAAIDNAAIALRNRGLGRADARAAAAPLFERFGLEGFEAAKPAELSGGMRQRVAFLRTLLAGKPILLLDEPFAGLDAISRGEMQEWLAGALAAEARTVVLVTHDVEEALYLCDSVAVLSARPGTILAELSFPSPRALPRRAAITKPEFGHARERALEALAGGPR
jgi:ABC-type nitrate/sulfonate/bicarbonate transport system ATPase subunit